jgi:glycosyltransferase involved in cell wall biosynthesis
MKFSIIIPTRNRPETLRIAFESVVAQTFDDFEVIVVNDGSEAKYNAAYKALKSEFGSKVELLNLEPSLHGHGAGFARNIGALNAKGEYLCFLDDDDLWIDNKHLSNANTFLAQTNCDVYLTKQQAYFDNQATNKDIWLSGLEEKLTHEKKVAVDGVFQVEVAELVDISGFAHLNTIITTKALFLSVNGIDESIRYEEDRDFYFRLIDKAEKIIFCPKEISRHNIPDRNVAKNLSTSVNELNKVFFQLYSLNKLILFSHHVGIQAFAKKHKIYALKHITEILHKEKNYKLASFYAKEAVLNGFNFKWLAFVIYLQIKSIFA